MKGGGEEWFGAGWGKSISPDCYRRLQSAENAVSPITASQLTGTVPGLSHIFMLL